MILGIRTDSGEAQLYLYDTHLVASDIWVADRELARDILGRISKLLIGSQKELPSLTGIVCYKGPGSFTALRIGLTVANTLAYSLDIPIVATESGNWLELGVNMLNDGVNHKVVLPLYGAEPNISMPRK
jgi:tRNA threonylcarbamoyladenosine biosynthesis protein TsaB